MGSKGVASVVAVIGVIALAAAGVYLYRHQGATPSAENKVATGEKPGAEPAKPAETKPAESKPTAVPDFIMAMKRRGHPESLIRKIVYDNPLEFFSQSRNFQFTPPEGLPTVAAK